MSDGGWGRGPVIDISSGRPVLRMPSFPRPPAGMIRLGLIGLAVLILLFTGYYQIEPDQVGVVQRLGAYRAHDRARARTSRSRSASRP